MRTILVLPLCFLLVLICLPWQLSGAESIARNLSPVVSNVSASQRLDGSKIVDITYDLNDPEGDSCAVSLRLSSNGGTSFDIVASAVRMSGDVGADIAPGPGKHIVWDAGGEDFELDGGYFYRVYADGGFTTPPPPGFILVEGGSFYNGYSTVTLGSYYLAQYELTQLAYQQVMGSSPSWGYGVGDSYPVYQVSWFKALEYCNRRSLQEGLTPCYQFSVYGSDPDNWPAGWDLDYGNHQYVSCDFNASGYRLPTDMEWEFAARGGNLSNDYIYSGSNIPGEVGWYYDNSGSYSQGHPDYGNHPVGLKLPNELGFYDMTGNVWEWCWDIYGALPNTPQTNPTGPLDGDHRIIRGGSWVNFAGIVEVDFRWYYFASHIDINIGFRVLRKVL